MNHTSNEKIWLLTNSTECDLARNLGEKGIPKEGIILSL
ncbi:MAG: hypothetical protein F6K19_45885 [Cyanothece sp. SIO1E1]|nr:hypothetical protein [Cyanothece sp. SIO1E1]